MAILNEKYLLHLIHELSIAQRALSSEGHAMDFAIFKLIHNISSFNLQKRNIDKLHAMIRAYCEENSVLQAYVNYALQQAYNYSIQQESH